MKILIDENIPYSKEFFAAIGEIETFPGRELQAEQLVDADALLVRSITKVNEQLLSQANKLQFVGTATIGEDHIDKPLLAERGITFTSAPGCNAQSVGEYVVSALMVLAEKYDFDLYNKTVGIVGVGNTGKSVQKKLSALGVNLLLCDPIRAKEEDGFIELNELLANSDIVTFHTPLIRDGEHPTYHLLNQQNIGLLKQDVCLVNACRGEVIDNQALYDHIQYRKENDIAAIKLVLDVWEGEPNPMQALIPLADLATAHIAGYSLEGKSTGTEMLYQALCKTFSLPIEHKLADFLPTAEISQFELTVTENIKDDLRTLIHNIYDVRRDDELFRTLLNEKGFDWLRKNYPVRREWCSTKLNLLGNNQKSINFLQLGFDI